ncbi:hypothetical protein GJ496_003175 [Pomphorhynchus laevis]|nr:hypothetical protein GJ496_003289 [Pomphorhynchus laevis]KAI0989657.1 hypothetical protein GJ496_003175 [Pomphorhynchus laevis]
MCAWSSIAYFTDESSKCLGAYFLYSIAEKYEVRLNEESKILENEQHRSEKLKTTMENKLISVVNERNDMKLGFEKKLHAMKTSAQKASITIDYLNNSLNLKFAELSKKTIQSRDNIMM